MPMKSKRLGQLVELHTSFCPDIMSYHKGDVDSSDNINLRVTSRLLRHKDKTFGVHSENLGAVLQESYIFPRPIFPGVERIKHQSVSPDVLF